MTRSERLIRGAIRNRLSDRDLRDALTEARQERAARLVSSLSAIGARR